MEYMYQTVFMVCIVSTGIGFMIGVACTDLLLLVKRNKRSRGCETENKRSRDDLHGRMRVREGGFGLGK